MTTTQSLPALRHRRARPPRSARVVGYLIAAAINLAYVAFDRRWMKRLGDALTGAAGFVVLLQLVQVFPFAFGSQWAGWETPFRILLGLGCIGAGIGVIANLGLLAHALGSSTTD